MVKIAIDYHDPFGQFVRNSLAGGHGDVVEKAKALAMVGEGVVEAAADMHSEPRFDGLAGGHDRPADRKEGKTDELGGITDLKGFEFRGAQAARLDVLEIARAVDEQDVFVRRRPGPEEILLFRTHGKEVLINEPVFLEREDMLAGLDHPVLVAEDELERKTLTEKHLEEIEEIAHAALTISKNGT